MVVVAENQAKKNVLSIQQRFELVQSITKDLEHVEVVQVQGLLMDFVRQQPKPWVLLRGVRSVNDYIYEHDRAMMNQALLPGVETVFLPSSPKYSSLSSTLVREIFRLNGSLDGFVSPEVKKVLRSEHGS